MTKPGRSFQSYLASIGLIKLGQAMLFSALIAFAVVMTNVYVTSKQIFESQLSAATNVFRMQILAGDLKRSQLVLKDILSNGDSVRVEFFDERGSLLFPDTTDLNQSLSLRLSAEQKIYFDAQQTSLFGAVRAEQVLRMDWFLFLTMFTALILSQTVAGYLFSSALKEVGQDLSAKLRGLRTEDISTDTDIYELNEIAGSINQMQKQLDEVRTTFKSPEELRRFAHDIRSPMSAISLALGTMDNLPAPARRVMNTAFSRMSSMTTSLLERPTPLSKPLGDSLQALLHEKLQEHKSLCLNWRLDLAGDTDFKISHTDELIRSVSNILNNAAEASPAGGLIVLRADVQADHVYIQVQDQGPGIPNELRKKVLRDGMTTKQKGNGIGLSSTYRLVKTWGGDVTLHHIPSGEFQVVLDIPRKALA